MICKEFLRSILLHKKSILTPIIFKIIELLDFYRYFSPPLQVAAMLASPRHVFEQNSKVLIIGATSDIAKAFLSVLDSANISCVCTSREKSTIKSPSHACCSHSVYLNLSSQSLISDLQNTDFQGPFSHIISFVGKLDRGSVSPLHKSNAFIEDFPDIITSNATGLFQVLQFLINKYNDYYKKHHLSISILTTSYALDQMPLGTSSLGYRAGKSLLNLLLSNLFLECRRSSLLLTILMCGPGFVRTKMTGYSGDITPRQAAHILYQNITIYGGIKKMIYVSSCSKPKSLFK